MASNVKLNVFNGIYQRFLSVFPGCSCHLLFVIIVRASRWAEIETVRTTLDVTPFRINTTSKFKPYALFLFF